MRAAIKLPPPEPVEPPPPPAPSQHHRLPRIVGLLLVLAGLLVVLEGATWWFVGHRFRRQLLSSVQKDCSACRLELPEMSFSLLRGTLRARDVKFIDNPKS